MGYCIIKIQFSFSFGGGFALLTPWPGALPWTPPAALPSDPRYCVPRSPCRPPHCLEEIAAIGQKHTPGNLKQNKYTVQFISRFICSYCTL